MTAAAQTFPGARSVYTRDPELGRIWVPSDLLKLVSLPGKATRRAVQGEVGIFIAKQHRPVYDEDGVLRRMQLLWASITHNERVDKGAEKQDDQCFENASATGEFVAVAVANATLTKTKTDLSLGSASADVTTNEFTGTGLARAAGSLSTYTAPSSLGGVFTRRIQKVFTATGNATGKGAGLFDSTTVAGSNLYVEDNFSSDAVLVNNDTLTVNIDVSN